MATAPRLALFPPRPTSNWICVRQGLRYVGHDFNSFIKLRRPLHRLGYGMGISEIILVPLP
jgi:hypothetical protein